MLAAHGRAARLLAAGTDLLVNMKKRTLYDVHPTPRNGEAFPGKGHPLAGTEAPGVLISLGRVAELSGVTELDDGRIRVGPMTTLTDLADHPVICEHNAALSEGAFSIGATTIRNRATVGGNLCNARPAADTAPPAIVLGASLAAVSAGGSREIPADQFMTAPGSSMLTPEELLGAILLPAPRPYQGSAYRKMGNREALEISIAAAAASVTLDGPGGTIAEARIALGAVGPTPIRATAAEAALVGKTADTGTLAAAARTAGQQDATPIDDHRGTAAYRREVIEVLTRRALEASVLRAVEGGQHG